MTRYEEQYYHDIHRIANAIEKIAKWFEKIEFSKPDRDINNIMYVSSHCPETTNIGSLKCPHCGSYKIAYLYTNRDEPDRFKCLDCGALWEDKYVTPSFTSARCEGCPIYEEMKKGKTVVNDACSFCSKNPFKVTCEAKQ